MNPATEVLEHASVKQYCKALRVPVIGANFVSLAEQAGKEKRNHIGYLEALLTMEAEERDRHAVEKRIHDARLPRMKTLEEFDFNQAPQIPAAKIRELAEGGYIGRAEPVVLMGECGTGKTHLATGLCVAACRQKRRVRFTTAANLVNELVEAQQHNGVRRVLARYATLRVWYSTNFPKPAATCVSVTWSSSERPRKASYAPSGGPDFKYRGPSLVPAASPSPGLEARMSSMRIPDDIQ